MCGQIVFIRSGQVEWFYVNSKLIQVPPTKQKIIFKHCGICCATYVSDINDVKMMCLTNISETVSKNS